MKDVLERLYEKAYALGNRRLTGYDLARLIDESKRDEQRDIRSSVVKLGGDLGLAPAKRRRTGPGRLGSPRSKLG